jgi:DDE superfamily endonuclease
VTFKEDEALRKEKWNDEYKGRRLVMWDNTDIKIYQPSDANNQRQTYSQYYGGNVAKGGVFVQPCGWSGTHELFPGSIGDSEYMIRSGAIILHERYLQKHDFNNQHIKFHIMLDKGYRITAQCYEEGGQMVVQPNFAKSDEKFTAFQTMRSAAIAADRSGNERVVKYMKVCGFIKYGLNPGDITEYEPEFRLIA